MGANSRSTEADALNKFVTTDQRNMEKIELLEQALFEVDRLAERLKEQRRMIDAISEEAMRLGDSAASDEAARSALEKMAEVLCVGIKGSPSLAEMCAKLQRDMQILQLQRVQIVQELTTTATARLSV